MRVFEVLVKLAMLLNTVDTSLRNCMVWRNVLFSERAANDDTTSLALVYVSSDIYEQSNSLTRVHEQICTWMILHLLFDWQYPQLELCVCVCVWGGGVQT